MIELTEESFAIAFAEWDRRFRENPEDFENFATQLLHGTPHSYGQSAASYFIHLLDELHDDGFIGD